MSATSAFNNAATLLGKNSMFSKLVTSIWMSHSEARQKLFREVLKDKTLKKLFDADYFKDIAARKLEQERKRDKLFLFEFTLTLFIALTLLSRGTTISFFGISGIEIGKLNEVLILISGGTVFYMALVASGVRALDDVLVAKVKSETEDDNGQKFLSLRYADNLFVASWYPKSAGELIVRGQFQKFSIFIERALFLALAIVFAVTPIAIMICAIYGAISEPAFSIYLSVFVAGAYIVGRIFVSVCSSNETGQLPYLDYSRLEEYRKTRVTKHSNAVLRQKAPRRSKSSTTSPPVPRGRQA